MRDEWITAKEALEIVSQAIQDSPANRVIAKRAHAGLIAAKAKRYFLDNQMQDNYEVPKKFWWAGGYDALEQCWDSGDFSTWVDNKYHLQAYGVLFRKRDIEETAGISTEADQWVSTKVALEMIESMSGGSRFHICHKVLEYLRIGHIEAKASAMKLTIKDRYETKHDDSVDSELVVPGWFWDKCTGQDQCVLDWQSGTFTGRGYVDEDAYQAKFLDVKLRASDLSLFGQDNGVEMASNASDASKPLKPPLPNSDLQTWWKSKAAIRDSLSQDELLALVKAKFPDNHISRDRIRALTGSRKRGPIAN
jgi:hypothetical protein